MLERREVLKLALASLAAGTASHTARAAGEIGLPGLALGDPQPFQPGMLADVARALAKQPFKAPSSDVPGPFRNLSYDQYIGIRNRPGSAIWANETVGFALEPLHRGFLFTMPVEINLVAQGEARRLLYNSKLYDFGKISVPSDMGDIGFSGFRILVPRDTGAFSEIATFQGASFFRAVAPGQNPGTMARALSIKTGDPRGEEFPMIRAFWIERPSLAGNTLVIHALIDSESVTGAYRFTLHTGEASIIDTECTLFARAAVDNLGLATMSAMALSGPLDHRRPDDIRPVIADIGGVQMVTGTNEWIWRPTSNRETLQISTFVDENPRGFGLLQRDRIFGHYQDDDQHWELRPSLWIEPIGDWGAGGIQLVEIPNDSESNDNIIAFWRPRQALRAGGEITYAYRQFWCWGPPARPELATVTMTRAGRAPNARWRRFLVEFAGEIFANPHPEEAVKPALSATPGSITSVRQFQSPEMKTCRIVFELDPGNDAYSELRLVLETAGKPISETWLYRWTR
ncbi:MAG: glucan biosynthesis protein [Beijerinckiaceae bacterium]